MVGVEEDLAEVIPLPVIPLPYKLGALAIALAVSHAFVYFKGRSHMLERWNAANAAAAVEQAKRQGEQDEKERMWETAMKTAGAKYDERAKIADSSFDTSLDRLRNAYSSSARLRQPAQAAGSCPEASGPTAADVLRTGEALAGILRDADLDRAALMACVTAWPR